MAGVPSPTPPPPLPLPFPATITPSISSSSAAATRSGLLIAVALLVFAVVATVSFHQIRRILCSRISSSSATSPSSSSSSSSFTPSPTPLLRRIPSPSPTPPPNSDRDELIDSLPLFSLATAVTAVHKSPDCAVCLSRFRPHDELRLLPRCRHAFHHLCIDKWLRSTPSCPLCRSSVFQLAPDPPGGDSSRSSSFRVELGNVSRRRLAEEETDVAGPAIQRSYSLGSSFEYLVDEDVEAVVQGLMRRMDESKDVNDGGGRGGGASASESEGGGGRGWLREYLDRAASSASSSFSSLRMSGRFSVQRVNSVINESSTHDTGGDGRSWDLEAQGMGWVDESGFGGVYRWLIGM
ncbi:hypothetical protein HPP92_014216 [Vanilla planifolia]|uniref:RING-type domain-containing protein n=1 Tax=Vanilla planifolia TaxID=51239 RepID=A0A835QJL4_VANPL|nr:hypothetical protein HPP92_014650 [Vanilla planifolia]KAG0474530.1 hypothetical protein HPP92_014216 [Vanilla planifolia]